ncbi:MAG: site-specific DNA-methyltransferase [Opitutaceae bacterium]
MPEPVVPERFPLAVSDLARERLARLRDLLPGAFAEGKLVPERLAELVGAAALSSVPERYGLSYAGRAEALREMLAPSLGTLRPDRSASVAWEATENLIVEGDNLHVLKLLQSAYAGAVKLIYIDPPYNTGNDFVYPDDFRRGLAHYKEQTQQTLSTNAETSGRYHSDWLKMLHPRLALARNLLRDDGVIFVSIDDHEVHNLRLLMDEVFGEENFVAELAIVRSENGLNSKPAFATNHDYMLVYQRSASPTSFRGLTPSAKYRDSFNKEDEWGRYRINGLLRKKGEDARREDRPNCWFPIYYDPASGQISLEARAGYLVTSPKLPDGGDGRWIWSPDYASQNLHRVHAGKEGTIYVKDYFDQNKREKPKTVWRNSEYLTEAGTEESTRLLGSGTFASAKPKRLIMDVVDHTTGPDDLVLDFFAGSGTTGQAVLELNRQDGGNRKFILVQFPEPTGRTDFPTIADITRERMRRVIARRPADLLDQRTEGFRAYRLEESNFKLWDGAAAPRDPAGLEHQLELMAHNVVDGRTDDDLLAELLLKCGHPGVTLSSPVEVRTVAGLSVHLLAEGRLAVCLSRELTREGLRGIVALAPKRVVCLEVGFQGNDELKTNIALELKSHGIQFQTV